MTDQLCANPDFPTDLAWGFYHLPELFPGCSSRTERVALGLYSNDGGADIEFCVEWHEDARSPMPAPSVKLFADAIEHLDPRSPIFACLAQQAQSDPAFTANELMNQLGDIGAYELTRHNDRESDAERFARARSQAITRFERQTLALFVPAEPEPHSAPAPLLNDPSPAASFLNAGLPHHQGDAWCLFLNHKTHLPLSAHIGPFDRNGKGRIHATLHWADQSPQAPALTVLADGLAHATQTPRLFDAIRTLSEASEAFSPQELFAALQSEGVYCIDFNKGALNQSFGPRFDDARERAIAAFAQHEARELKNIAFNPASRSRPAL